MCIRDSNRDGADGSFADTGKAAAVVKLTSADADSSISFQTTTSNNAEPTPRVTIDKSGNVGIGETSPDRLFHVKRSDSGGTAAKFENSAGTVYLELNTNNQGSGDSGYIGYNSTKDMLFLTDDTERMRIDASGRLNLGGTSTTAQAGVIFPQGYRGRQGIGGTETNTFNLAFQASGATQVWIDYTNIGNLTVSSDYRIKRNIETQTADALTRVKQIRPVTYQRAKYQELFEQGDEVKEGFIAHELAEIIPSAVEGEKDSSNQIQSLNLDALCSVLTKAIQEQQVIIDDLKARIETLEG